MVERKINGHSIVFYDEPEELPIVHFHRYSKYLLVEAGIGDTIQDIDAHISKIINLLDDKKKAYRELLNLRQCIYAVASEQDIRHKATLCLVKSVDGREWEDFSEEGLSALYGLINGASDKEFMEASRSIRKKIDDNLHLYFPKLFDDSVEKNYTDLLRKKALLQIKHITEGEENEKEIAEVNRMINSMQEPKNFEGPESVEVQFDKRFEEMCLVMAREFGGGIKQYTTMEFYSAFERLQKESEEQKKQIKKRRIKK